LGTWVGIVAASDGDVEATRGVSTGVTISGKTSVGRSWAECAFYTLVRNIVFNTRISDFAFVGW